MNDVVLNKVQNIQRCVMRAREVYAAARESFRTDCICQDAAILHVTRACEQAIDLANHVIRMAKAGVPTDSAESFSLLVEAGIISRDLCGRLKKMIGFRNTVIHLYQSVDIGIVEAVITSSLDDLVAFTEAIMAWEEAQ